MAKRQEELPLAKPIKRMSKRRFALIVAVLVGALLVLYLLISAGLSLNSLTSGDLILFAEPSTEYLRLEHGQTETLTYTLGVNNLPFCQATCNWSITDLATGATLREGTDTFESEQKQDYELSLEAPARGRIVKPYQFRVQCVNARTQYCKAEEGTKQTAVTTTVEIQYTQEEASASESLQAQLASWSTSQQEQARTLAGIAAVKDSRVQAVAAQAAADARTASARYKIVADALRDDDVLTALAAVEEPFVSTVVATYMTAVAHERAAVANYTVLYERPDIINALLAIDAPTRAAINETLAARLSFNRLPPAQADEVFYNTVDVSADAVVRLGQLKLAAAREGQQLLAAEQRMACTLKTAPCPSAPAAIDTLPETVASLRATCTELRALPAYFSAAHQAYALALEPTRTVDETEAMYNVSEIRAGSDFDELAAEMRADARNGTLTTVDPSLRLAVPLIASEDSLSFVAQHCDLSTETVVLPEPPVATLPALPNHSVSFPPLAIADQHCCSTDTCSVCNASTQPPVVFVHGHSFTDSSSPEYNMYAFVPLALTLQEEGYVYAGHVFPREDLDAETYGELQHMPAASLFTATYYYNSYPEEGRTAFIAHKSENIETYAIRLKEAIDVVQHKTGQDKVIIVAHSMGGLVTRRYLQIFGEDDVVAVMLIGTPNYGITGRISALCPILGGEKECEDMAAGSIFLAKLNNARAPSVPFATIAGAGCEGDFDGIVETGRVALDFADNTVVEGSCVSSSRLLHSLMLEPQFYPDVYEQVRLFIGTYTR